MPATSDDWVRGFARQAQTDLRTWYVLQSEANDPLPSCISLHFLQMACEKLCKSHLVRLGSDWRSLQSSHAYIEKQLPILIRDRLKLSKETKGKTNAIVRFAKHLAREIEMLSPAVDDGRRRPDNCEYPWLDGLQNLHVPIDWQFPVENLLNKPHGMRILKLIAGAINWLLD